MGQNEVKIIAVGDIFVGEHPVTSGHGVDYIVKKYGADHLFKYINHITLEGDIVIGNLETVISKKGKKNNSFISQCYRGRPSVAKAMSRAGINTLTIANNHIMQHGIVSLDETRMHLKKNRIKYTGVNEVNPNTSIPIIYKINGIKVAVIGYCCISQQYYLNNQIVCIGNYENIFNDIKKIRNKCDYIILALHWGDEFVDTPSPDQINLGRRLIDCGANIILGNHSHVLQGIEKYKNGIIVYSLGSLIKDLWKSNMKETVIFKCTLTKNEIKNLNYTPIFINDEFQPVVANDILSNKILTKLEKLSKDIERNNLKNYNTLMKKYIAFVKKCAKKDRKDTYYYYLKNFDKYNKKMLIKNFVTVIKRRIIMKNI